MTTSADGPQPSLLVLGFRGDQKYLNGSWKHMGKMQDSPNEPSCHCWYEHEDKERGWKIYLYWLVKPLFVAGGVWAMSTNIGSNEVCAYTSTAELVGISAWKESQQQVRVQLTIKRMWYT